MRNVRSLSSLAGPGASLAQVGSGAVSDVARLVHLVCQAGVSGDGVNIGGGNTWGATVPLPAAIEAGDQMMAMLHAGAWHGPVGSPSEYGETAIHPDDGWTLIHEDTSLDFSIWTKTATGLDTSIRAGALRSGGISVIVLRGYEIPTVADLTTNADVFPALSNTDTEIPALGDQTYDAIIAVGYGSRNGYMGITNRYQDAPAGITQLGGGSGTQNPSFSWAGGLYLAPEGAGIVTAVGGYLNAVEFWRFGLRKSA